MIHAFRATALTALLLAAGCTSSKYVANMDPSGEWVPANSGQLPGSKPRTLGLSLSDLRGLR